MNPSRARAIADIIRNARASNNMNMRDFGAALGISHTMVSLYELERGEPSLDQLEKWLHHKTDWIADMAVAILVERYRTALSNLRTPLVA